LLTASHVSYACNLDVIISGNNISVTKRNPITEH